MIIFARISIEKSILHAPLFRPIECGLISTQKSKINNTK